MGVRSKAAKRSGRRGQKRRATSSRSTAGAREFGSTAIRLVAGIVSLSVDGVKNRLEAIPRDVPHPEPARERARGDAAPPTVVSVATGLAIVSTAQASRLAARARAAGTRAGAGARSLAGLPLIGRATRPARRRAEQYRRAILRLSELGREAELEGRRMVLHLIEDTTSASVKDIAETAIKEVTHSPEVASLVRTESAGLATGAILEVRASSEQADASVERKVQTWLHPARANDAGRPPPGGVGPAA
jgi:hypothetical protein